MQGSVCLMVELVQTISRDDCHPPLHHHYRKPCWHTRLTPVNDQTNTGRSLPTQIIGYCTTKIYLWLGSCSLLSASVTCSLLLLSNLSVPLPLWTKAGRLSPQKAFWRFSGALKTLPAPLFWLQSHYRSDWGQPEQDVALWL